MFDILGFSFDPESRKAKDEIRIAKRELRQAEKERTNEWCSWVDLDLDGRATKEDKEQYDISRNEYDLKKGALVLAEGRLACLKIVKRYYN